MAVPPGDAPPVLATAVAGSNASRTSDNASEPMRTSCDTTVTSKSRYLSAGSARGAREWSPA
jgi:hypothetical protein